MRDKNDIPLFHNSDALLINVICKLLHCIDSSNVTNVKQLKIVHINLDKKLWLLNKISNILCDARCQLEHLVFLRILAMHGAGKGNFAGYFDQYTSYQQSEGQFL